MAIVHIAVFDAVNAISGRYRSYTGLSAAARNTSMEAAIAQAAHDTLSALFPSQRVAFDEQLAHDLDAIKSRRSGNSRSISDNAQPPQSWASERTTARRTPTSLRHRVCHHDEPANGVRTPVSLIPLALGATGTK